MKKILVVTSSLMGEMSQSRKIALTLADSVRAALPDWKLNVRDATQLPLITLDYLGGLRAKPEQLSAAQQTAVNLGDQVIAEVEEADIVIVAAPMYSYTVPAALKVWIEYMNRPGRVFSHGAEGAVGLLTGKKVFAVLTRGSEFAVGDTSNFQENFLVSVLGSFGLAPVQIILAEGTAHEGGKAALAAAEQAAHAAGQQLAQELVKQQAKA